MTVPTTPAPEPVPASNPAEPVDPDVLDPDRPDATPEVETPDTEPDVTEPRRQG